MERIEIEPQERYAAERRNGCNSGTDKNGPALLPKEPVHRCKRGETDLGLFARRPHQPEQRRQHGDRQHEGHDHADAGDQAKFGNAYVTGRKEGEEPRRGCGRRERERLADAAPRPDQRRFQIAGAVPFRTVAHAVLDSEIDAETDKEGNKRDRNDVEHADNGKSNSHGEREPAQQRDKYARDDAERMHREPERQGHREKHDGAHQIGTFSERRELLVGQRHRSGQTHPHALVRRQAEIARGIANGIGRCGAGRERVEVERGLHRDKAAQPGPIRMAREKRLPGKIGAFALCHRTQRACERLHRLVELIELGLSVLNAHQRRRKRVHHTAQTWVGGERAKERLCRDHLLHRLFNVSAREEQQSVLEKERAAARFTNDWKQLFLLAELFGQKALRALRQLGRRTIDDNKNEAALLREQRIVACFPFAPFELGREKLRAVRVHPEVPGGVEGSCQRREQEASDYGPGIAAAQGDDGLDDGHGVTIPCDGICR